MIYYGGVTQAAYVSVLIFLVVAVAVLMSTLDYYATTDQTSRLAGNTAIEPSDDGAAGAQQVEGLYIAGLMLYMGFYGP